MEINWTRRLHNGGQIEVFHDKSRFKVLSCGTRWGKTRLVANIILDRGLKERSDIWWVAPTYDLADRGLAALYASAPMELFGKENKVKKILPLINGTQIQFRTADNPVSLLGKGIHFLVIDEAAQIRNEIWERYLRRTLLDHKGSAIFISTPRGRNWFHKAWLRGQDSLDKEYKSWQFPTTANPTLDINEVQKAMSDVPELIRRQEYEAEFIDEANQVFRKVDEGISGGLEEPQLGRSYSGGVDLAKHRDFTVIIILNDDGHLVYYDRFHQLDWGFQKQRIKFVADLYSASMLIDSTGLGDPIYDDLKAMDVDVQSYKFTNPTKRQLIENLSIQLENRNITFPKIDQLINELKAFECNIGPTGTIHYSGDPDDSVIAFALAVWQQARIITGIPKAEGQRETALIEQDF